MVVLDGDVKEWPENVAAMADADYVYFKVHVEGDPKSLQASDETLALILDTDNDASTGRRLAFARWLTDSQNPLTARVAVNHLWARHFGVGIVPSVDDFGRNGRPPGR